MPSQRIAWQDAFSCGVPEIDRQHQHFLSMINNVIMAKELKYPRPIIDQLLLGLVKYSEVHFRSEELLMRAKSYPDLERHAKTHAEIIRLLEAKVEALAQEAITLENIVEMLVAWFRLHTTHDDLEIGRFLGH